MELNNIHLQRNVPLFLKAQNIIESSDNYTIEEILSVEKELEVFSKEISEMRNIIYKLAHDKWSKQYIAYKKV